MKKLMFATALGVSVVGFGTMAAPETYNATSFEEYTANGSILSDKGDLLSPAYFCYTDGDADGSSVKEFGEGDNLAAPSITRPYYWSTNTTNNKYLELSTEGGILWRSINTIGGTANAYTPGTAQPVAATGTYLDTLVQFTPTEGGDDPALEPDVDKLAIWLNVDSQGNTNLMARAKYYFFNGGPDAVATNFVLVATEGTKSIVAGSWYRLTVKAIPNILDGEGAAGVIPGFEIYVDGVQMCATEPQFESGEGGFAEMASDMATATTAAAIGANKLFPSLAQMGNLGDPVTLQGVGFKGSGAIDDLVWTEEDPFANAGGDAAWIDEVTEVFVGANLSQAEKAAIASWATANNITVAAGSEEIAAAAYLLNLTTLPGAVPELTITSIEEGAEAWTLTVAASDDGDPLALPASLNGVVTLTQSATLAGLSTATPATANFSIANGTATVTVAKDAAAAKFMKVGVGIAPPANAQQE